MARTLPFNRSAQATRVRLSKMQLLPMPRAEADTLSLHAHCALQALRDGTGWMAGTQSLAEVLILTAYVTEAGYGHITREAWLQGEIAINAAFAQGQATGVWKLDDASCQQLAGIVCVHDAQLHNAPLGVLAAASERLERLKAGEADPMPKLKRA
ncbi:hypothetical protein [Caballeronia sp. LjRoot31]|uniref:hypothetical protein n=1 Tax=Caballeronia sp. LjRoot31 TaxID=3342324 RepID=UPI003ECEC98F